MFRTFFILFEFYLVISDPRCKLKTKTWSLSCFSSIYHAAPSTHASPLPPSLFSLLCNPIKKYAQPPSSDESFVIQTASLFRISCNRGEEWKTVQVCLFVHQSDWAVSHYKTTLLIYRSWQRVASIFLTYVLPPFTSIQSYSNLQYCANQIPGFFQSYPRFIHHQSVFSTRTSTISLRHYCPLH